MAGFLIVAMIVPPLPWCLLIALIVSLAAVAGARAFPGQLADRPRHTVSFALTTALGIVVQAVAARPRIFF